MVTSASPAGLNVVPDVDSKRPNMLEHVGMLFAHPNVGSTCGTFPESLIWQYTAVSCVRVLSLLTLVTFTERNWRTRHNSQNSAQNTVPLRLCFMFEV